MGEGLCCIVFHADALRHAEELATALQALLHRASFSLTTMTAPMGVLTGPGPLAYALCPPFADASRGAPV
jgi:fatty acid-binding protein DegV